MAKITYTNKVTLNPQPSIADENKVTSGDMNEIKSSVNILYDNQGDLSSLQTTTKSSLVGAVNELKSGEVYSSSEIKTNKVWIDGKPIYRKVLYDTTSRSAGNYSIAHGIQNYDEIISYKTLCYQSSSVIHDGSSTSALSGSERVTSYFNDSNISIRTSWAIVKTIIIIEYTKTTD